MGYFHIVAIDPCQTNTSKEFGNAGSRNEKCSVSEIPHDIMLCDSLLIDGWYFVPNATILNHAPTKGSCGFNTPLWMLGSPVRYRLYSSCVFLPFCWNCKLFKMSETISDCEKGLN